ncbi:MAG: LPS export ABC transporter periplasmic protein LptC [Gammaproteobacteria bacterium]|nr:LPS export ABC transporter periplasmic protein LptC [Gammaproteobacteria bacterium]
MKWSYAFIAAALAIGFLYMLSGDEAPVLKPFPEELSDEPDAFMEGFEITQFNGEGQKLYEVVGVHASYYEARGVTDIHDLRMAVYAANNQIWRLSATDAVYEERHEDPFLLLNGNVRLISADGDLSTLAFSTESLKIYPRRRWVESLSRVTLENADSKIHANKLEADLDSKQFRFSSGVDDHVELVYRTDS